MKIVFPKGFLWGTATSAHQVEGGNTRNDWWEFERGHSAAKRARSNKACNHYELFDADFVRARKLHNNTHRFSLEWSRIEIEEGIFDRQAIDHYRQVFRSLRRHKLKPFVTLHHFTLPQWLARKGGWEHPRAPSYFRRFVRKMMEEFHQETDMWITINEPIVFLYRGYVTGSWPPARRNFWRLWRAYRHVLSAHRKAYRTIHRFYRGRKRKCSVGIAASIQRFDSHGCKWLDTAIARLLTFVWNNMFFLLSIGYHDFIGVNYYLRNTICFRWRYPFYVIVKEKKTQVSDLGWEIYPHGLHYVLTELWNRYRLPLFVTENGVAAKSDALRCKFLIAHLVEMKSAMDEGVKIFGYFHWSLLDNYEWDLGFNPRFGLYHVNYRTMKRTIKESGKIYARICRTNSISSRLVSEYAAELQHQSVEEVCRKC